MRVVTEFKEHQFFPGQLSAETSPGAALREQPSQGWRGVGLRPEKSLRQQPPDRLLW